MQKVPEQAVISQTQPFKPEFDNGRLCIALELVKGTSENCNF